MKDEKIKKANSFFEKYEKEYNTKYDISKFTDEEKLRLLNKIEQTYSERYNKIMKEIENTYTSDSSSKWEWSPKYTKQELENAYTFFTHLDTSTTTGYDVSALTEDEIIKLYKEIKLLYPKKYQEVMDKVKSENRSVQDMSANNDDKAIIPSDTNSDIAKEDDKQKDTDSSPENEINEEDNLKQKLEDDKQKAIDSLYSDGDKNEVDLSKFGLSDDTNEKDSEPEIVKSKREPAKNKLNKLLKRLKEDSKFRKKVIAVSAGVAVACGAIGVIAYSAITGDTSSMQNTGDIASQAQNIATQMSDPNVLNTANEFNVNSVELSDINFDLDNVQNIFSSASDAANLVDGLTPDQEAGNIYFADLYNNTTGEWMNIDPNSLTLDDLNNIVNNGDYSVAYTNDSNLVGQSGEKLANNGLITGFGNIDEYINMAQDTIKNSKGL